MNEAAVGARADREWLNGLATPEVVRQRTQEIPPAFTVNAHVHLPPNFSAFSTVGQAVDLAAGQGLTALGASNYYDYTIYGPFAAQARKQGIFPLFGIEIITLISDLSEAGVKVNDPGNPGKMYVCGKGISAFHPMSVEAAGLLNVIRQRDSERMAAMVERLTEVFQTAGLDTGLTEPELRASLAERYGRPVETIFLQERHVAQAFQEATFARFAPAERGAFWEKAFGVASKADPENAAAVQNEIRSHLMKAGKSAYVPETFVTFEHAIRLILALGGIPCYPTLIDGANPICPFEAPVDAFIGRLKERGFCCAELIPIRNRANVLASYVRALRAEGLVVTAGTEHNTLDLLPLAPTCLNEEAIPEDVQAIFNEGACVVAAHQYLTANGETGFVDGGGVPNPDFSSNEERIAAFRSLGAAVIAEAVIAEAARTR